ncbi:MAG: cyclic nucleotide-binding domain-containing protein [Verrucomicrobiae bacterium]|nr:cyclic nucleotide-binding domain-containing protein [Verrucomicrobiae bacterium]
MNTKLITASYRVWSPEMVCYGPIELTTLFEWVRERRVSPEHWIFSERRNTWVKAAQMDELKPLFDSSRRRPGHLLDVRQAGVNADALLRIKVFSGLNEDQLQAFIRYMEMVVLEPAALAVREGQRGDAMFLILEGEVRVRWLRHGKESIVTTLRTGDFFGEISLLDEGPRSADVIANEHTTLLKISKAAFTKLRSEAPSLAEPFLHSLSQILVGRLRQLNKRYVDSVLMLRALSEPTRVKTTRPAAKRAR